MSRYPTPHTFNTGSLAAATAGTFNRSIGSSEFDIMKIKVVPSAVSVGYKLEIFKKDTYLAADLLFSTIENVNGNLYIPTDKSGNEVLEGFVVPYEDLDVSGELHIRITNHDAVARTYQVTVTYQISQTAGATPTFSGLILSTLPATAGTIRMGNAQSIKGRNLANNANINMLNTTIDDEVVVGSPSNPLALHTNLQPPTTLANGYWWIENLNGYPVVKARISGVTRTIYNGITGTLAMIEGGDISFYANVTSGPRAVAGQIRGQHGFSMYATDFAGTSSYALMSWGWGDAGQNELCIGSPSKHTKISTNLAPPSSPGNGEFWVECVGTTPSRVCALKVRDGGATITIASVTI